MNGLSVRIIASFNPPTSLSQARIVVLLLASRYFFVESVTMISNNIVVFFAGITYEENCSIVKN